MIQPVITLCITAAYMQWAHHRHVLSERDYVNTFKLSEDLTKKIGEVLELKKHVDSLLLKAGFKL